MRILVVNAGSSSLKLRVIGDDDELESAADDIAIASFIADVGPIDAIGHRVVHGGPDYQSAVLITDKVTGALAALEPLAPLHQRAALRGIEEATAALPHVAAVACFDTAFHATMPLAATTYALPREWIERWQLRRYGFHGLSHSWAARRGAALIGGNPRDLRIVVCHLGAGASCCAVRYGRSVDTTMGFTPVAGLVMATRSGSVDPGLVTWLTTEAGLSAHEVADALQSRSGFAGLAGGTGDVREVITAAEVGDDWARLALDVATHRLRGAIASMTASCGGLDLLVFTGGVGEHQPDLRADACEGLSWLGVELDFVLNAAATGDAVVSPRTTPVAVAVVTSREDLQITREVRALLRS